MCSDRKAAQELEHLTSLHPEVARHVLNSIALVGERILPAPLDK